jgi:two-component system sensor histidine kinase VicK
MKDEFINVAAHELRTPIQPILGLSDLVHSEVTDPRHSELLEVVVRNAKRLKRLTDNILDVTKIESQSLKLNKEQVNLNIIISEVLKEYKGKIDDRITSQYQQRYQGLKISYKLQEDDDIILEADRNRLAQLISNLLSNSINFTNNEDGIITIMVDTKNNNHDVTVAVKDNGQGIEPEDFPNLFTKFFTKSDKGTGLGLFICKSIVEAHGGKIWAQNNADGKGVTFSFSLPI